MPEVLRMLSILIGSRQQVAQHIANDDGIAQVLNAMRQETSDLSKRAASAATPSILERRSFRTAHVQNVFGSR